MSSSITDADFCTDLTGYYPVHDYIPGLRTNIGIVLLVGGLLNIFMSLVTVLWINRQKHIAQEETDNDEAVKSVIFPVFVRILWLSVTINIVTGMLIILAPLRRAGENSVLTSALFASVWAMQHGVLEGVAFLLMQKGCGQHAATRVRQLSAGWITFVFALMFCSFYYGGVVTTVLSAVRDTMLVLFYAVLLWAPQEGLFRRPAALFYSKCWLLYRGFFLGAYIFMLVTDTAYLGDCGYIVLSLFVFAIIQPLIMYITLLRDSLWWQGIEINAQAARGSEHDLRHPLLGAEYSLQSAQALAGTLDEMRVRGNVTMLNFACIKLDTQTTLGAGSFSKVYKGTYRGADCAIKLIYTMDITADTIKKVAAEASILSSIRHKNIVNIIGVSVLPPSVCLVLELCSFGSLSDIIRGYGFDWSNARRAPLKLAYPDILYLALGCARGLAAVHAYDSSLCHRDVKSFNFLVDHQFNVKIADLELGVMTGSTGLSAYDVPAGREEMPAYEDSLSSTIVEHVAPMRRREPDPESVNVSELLANWLAPEVILVRKFRQASDVYSLGTVLWEILSGLLPFDGEKPIIIRRKIVSGYTHPIPPQYVNTTIGTIISSCWEFEHALRPTAAEICALLEKALDDHCYLRINNVESIPDMTILRNFYDTHYRKSVYGDARLHRVLFADLSQPTCLQYLNPCNWYRYLCNVYAYNRYRGLSVDDSEASGSDDGTYDVHTTHTNHVSTERSSMTDVNRQLFEGDVESDSGLTSRSSYVVSDGGSSLTAMYAQLPRAALDVIGVIKEEPYWAELERSGAAWAVTTIDAPYIVMHATSAWYKMFNIKYSQGSYQHMYSIMSLIGRDSTVEDATGTITTAPLSTAANTTSSAGFTSSNAYVSSWKDDSAAHNRNKNNKNTTHHSAANALLTELHEGYRTNRYKQVHGVLCFSLPKKKASSSAPNHTNPLNNAQGHNLMCTLHAYPIYASTEEPPVTAADTAMISATNAHTLSETNTNTNTNANTNTNNGAGSLIHTLSSSKLALSAPHRNLVAASPMREFSLHNNARAGAMSPLGSASSQPAETPSMLRRTTTQMSSQSFADTIRSTKRPAEPDTPRPVYFAILFHELSEQPPVVPESTHVNSVTTTTHAPLYASSSNGGSGGIHSAHLDSSGAHSVSGSPSSSGLSGALQSLLPRSISRLFSADLSVDSRDDKGEYVRVSSVDEPSAGSHSHRTRSSGSSNSRNSTGSNFSGPRATFYSGDDSNRATREVRHYSTS